MNTNKKHTFLLLLALFGGIIAEPAEAGFFKKAIKYGAGAAAVGAVLHSAQATPKTVNNQFSADTCDELFPNHQKPVTQKAGRFLCFDDYAVLHSAQTRTPIYSVEKLNAKTLAHGSISRTENFYEEARLPSNERAALNDYAGSGYDRGHMSPAADRTSANGMAQSFSLANMVPQAPKNNRGVWAKQVEGATRKYADRAQGDVFVFTGPAYVTNRGNLKGRVAIPSHLYKLVYDATTHRAWAYWVENTDEARVDGVIPYRELVNRTGIEFLPGVPVQN